MPDFTFHYRLTVAQRSAIGVDEPRLILRAGGQPSEVVLASMDRTVPLSKAKDIALYARGWTTEAEAHTQGSWYSDHFVVTLAHHRVGVYPEHSVARSGFFPYGLKMLEERAGQRVLNDAYGLSVYATEPRPMFVKMGATGVIQPNTDAFVATFNRLCSAALTLTTRDRLALALFNTSFIQPSAATRLLTLVMAVESLIQPEPRSPEATALVQSFLDVTAAAPTITIAERDSLSGSLRQLRLESIGSAGRRLVRGRLGNRTYMGLSAPAFFTHAYSLRSQLVHGNEPQPSDPDVGSAAGAAELFVSDLVTQPFVPLRQQ